MYFIQNSLRLYSAFLSQLCQKFSYFLFSIFLLFYCANNNNHFITRFKASTKTNFHLISYLVTFVLFPLSLTHTHIYVLHNHLYYETSTLTYRISAKEETKKKMKNER